MRPVSVEFRTDAPDEFRFASYSGKHSGEKEQVARLHRFRVDAERLRRRWKLMPSCLSRCSAVARREPSPLKFCLSNPSSLILLQRLRLIAHILNFPQSSHWRLLRCRRSALSHKISQAIFGIAGFAKASLYQRFDSPLRSRSCHRSNTSIPPGFDFDIRRQTSNVD
jgi:hypothetical protein